MTGSNGTRKPRVFLCHGSPDKPLARQIATDLQAAGIETFFDEWEIRSGDSLRQKIDAGLGECTHFIALLTPDSIERPWVNAEMDAAFVRKVNGQARFIPLRSGLESSALPPLLQALHSPKITDYAKDIRELIGDIFEISRKPPLGTPPSIAQRTLSGSTGLSPAAERVAEIFARKSENGRANDPQLSVEELRETTGLSDIELADAVDELKDLGMVKPARVLFAGPFGYHMVWADSRVFEVLDPFVMGWHTDQDALVVAAKLVNDTEQHGHASLDLMNELGWNPRRINPAVKYLIDRDLVMASTNVHPVFVSTHIFATPKTRRFVRQQT